MRNYYVRILVLILAITTHTDAAHTSSPTPQLTTDCNGDGITEHVIFDPTKTQWNESNSEHIICRIMQQETPLVEFVVDSSSLDTIEVKDGYVWHLSPCGYILAIEVWRDTPRARMDVMGTIHFFLITSELVVQELMTVEGSSEYTISASSGLDGVTTVTYIQDASESPYFFITQHKIFEEYRSIEQQHSDEELYQGCVGWYTHTTTTTFQLSYDPETCQLREEQHYVTEESACIPPES